MAGLDPLRWAGHLIRQALDPDAAAPPADECFAPETQVSAAASARGRVASSYEAKLKQNRQRHEDEIAKRTRCYWYIVACAVAIGVIAYLSIGGHRTPLWPAGLPAAAGILAFIEARLCKSNMQHASCLMDLYRDRLRRVRYQWMGKGDSGKDLEINGH